jgi:hypothetical protein
MDSTSLDGERDEVIRPMRSRESFSCALAATNRVRAAAVIDRVHDLRAHAGGRRSATTHSPASLRRVFSEHTVRYRQIARIEAPQGDGMPVAPSSAWQIDRIVHDRRAERDERRPNRARWESL